MQEAFDTIRSAHNGASYSTIIIFGAFTFLLLMTFLSYGSRVTDVLRKASFFSMMLLYVQGLLGVSMAFNEPSFSTLEGGSAYFSHFEYALSILVCAGVMTFVYSYLKKNEIVSRGVVVLALLAVLLFEYAYPWSIIFG